MFVGRKEQLNALEAMYRSDRFEMPVIYGRRRVGKTTLISEFIKDKRAIYFQGLETDVAYNLQELTNQISLFQNGVEEHDLSLPNFDVAFTRINNLALEKPLVFVIDEFPYLANSFPAISSILQKAIDHSFLDNPNLTLILAGSSMSFMEHQVLGYQSPLYGRRTAQFKLEPFTIFEAREMLPNVSREDLMNLYAVTGGIPQYLRYVDEKLTFTQNVEHMFFHSYSPLFEEPGNLLKQELRDPARYNSVLNAIATGASRLNDIANKVQIASGAAAKYLTNLIELGIVVKKVPVIGGNKKQSIYQISDNMFHFWYEFVGPETAAITRGVVRVDEVLNERLNAFVGQVFEEVARDWLWRKELQGDILPFHIADVGMWWGSDAETKQQEEIDVVAVDGTESNSIVGECKWRNGGITIGMLDKLMDRQKYIPTPNHYLYFFTKSADEATRQYARDHEIKMVEYDKEFFV